MKQNKLFKTAEKAGAFNKVLAFCLSGRFEKRESTNQNRYKAKLSDMTESEWEKKCRKDA